MNNFGTIAKNFGKNLTLWIIIGLLLVMVFNLFQGTENVRVENVPTPIKLLMNWWPMPLLIAVALFVMRQMLERRRP